jgi:hypothetical protein
MLLTELAVQNVAGFPPTARLSLKAGLNALVAKDCDVVRLVRVVLFGESGLQQFCSGAAPHKAALTIVGADGHSWRVVRDLGTGSQSLLRSDAATKQVHRISEDPAEIARWLATTVGLPGEAALKSILTLAAGDMPSRVAASRFAPMPTMPSIVLPSTNALSAEPAGISVAEARQKLPALREELGRAEGFERAQDELYGLQNRFGELSKGLEGLQELEAQINDLAQKAIAVRGQNDLGAGLEQKIRRYPEAQARRDAAL